MKERIKNFQIVLIFLIMKHLIMELKRSFSQKKLRIKFECNTFKKNFNILFYLMHFFSQSHNGIS
jgi:hypothetical protein